MSTPLPILAHMPTHIKENLIKRLDLDDRMRLRRCSKQFKTLVDDSKQHFKTIIMTNFARHYFLGIYEADMKYEIDFFLDRSNQENCRRDMYKLQPGEYGSRGHMFDKNLRLKRRTLRGVGFRDAMFVALACFFRNVQKLTIGRLIIEFHSRDDSYERLQALLSNLNGPLPVEAIRMCRDIDERRILQVLPYVEPGTLQRVNISPALSLSPSKNIDFTLDALVQLEQWKQANFLHIDGIDADYDLLPGFKFVKIRCKDAYLVDTLLTLIRKAEEREEQFEFLYITNHTGRIRNYIMAKFPSLCGNPEYRYKKHPTLDCYLRFSYDHGGTICFVIRRVSSTTFQPTDLSFPDIT